MRYTRISVLLICALLLMGCSTPTVNESSRTMILDPDEEDNLGGTFLESSDIRTIAQQMSGAILSTPEVSSNRDVTRIAISPVRNNTRFLIDSDIFLTRLRIELNRVSQGRVRFFMQDGAQAVRSQVLLEQDETDWAKAADELVAYLLEHMPTNVSEQPKRLAIGTVKQTNITGMNADSFLAILRAHLVEQAEGKVVFVSNQASQRIQDALQNGDALSDFNVDYVLSGEFLAQGMQTAEGKQELELKIEEKREVFGETYAKEDTKEETLVFEKKQNPNVTKHFNCQLVEVSSDTVICEKMVSLERKMTTGLGKADYILTGQLNALSKATQGAYRSDYVIVSFQLVAPDTNELLWEDAYESKRATRVGTVYR